MVQRGTFIVFEGLDRCGKSTQVARLEESLRSKGQIVRTQKFPGELLVLDCDVPQLVAIRRIPQTLTVMDLSCYIRLR